MSISSRQVKKEVSRIIEDKMKDGYIPTVDYVNAQLGVFYSKYSVGSPFFKNRKQPYRKVFNVDDYNSNISEIYDDINNLYEEIVSQFTVVLTDFDFYETQRQQILHQIKDLSSTLYDLIFTANDTEGYVYSVHDEFIDRSKVDLTYSTCEINTAAGIATIRESKSGIAKIDMSHYFNVINFPILVTDQYSGNLISNTIFPMSKFGYAFSDIGASWDQNVITNKPGKLQMSFIVDLNPGSDAGEDITRIEIRGHSVKDMYITPLYSFDNVNFVAFSMGYAASTKKVSDDKITVWNFDVMNIKYIKFIIDKEIEDEQININNAPAYRYVIGFKHIEFFKMGYDTSSILYSKPYYVKDPAGESLTIDKAALVVDSDVQAGTSISYYLSLGTEGVSDPGQFYWAPVSAVDDPTPMEQQIVDFKHVAFFNNVPDVQWDPVTYGTKLETYYGIDFYKIYQFPYEPVKGSMTLYRGKNNWQVTPKFDVVRKQVYDEQHQFGTTAPVETSTDVVILNNPTFTPVEGVGIVRGTIRVKSDPGQQPTYFATTPADFIANYSAKTLTRTVGSVIDDDPTNPANTVYVDYQYDDEIAEPTIYTTNIYILNPDGINVNHAPFSQAEIDAGQYTNVTTSEGDLDISTMASIHLAPGWHTITTTGEPQSVNDRFFTVNGSKYLHELVYQQFAFAQKLQETSWFDLKYNTLKTDHSKFAITDYEGDGNKEIIINYRPQTEKFNVLTLPWNDMLCADGEPETYVLSYKFITTQTDTIYFKAVMSRLPTTAPTATPTLRSYTIKLGY